MLPKALTSIDISPHQLHPLVFAGLGKWSLTPFFLSSKGFKSPALFEEREKTRLRVLFGAGIAS